MKNIIFFFLFSILLMACPSKNNCIKNYIFDIPISVTPSTEIFKTGDTISVLMNTDNTNIHDTHGDRIVNIPNFDPRAWFLLPIVDSFPVKDGFSTNEIIIDEKYIYLHKNVSTLTSGIFFQGIDTMELESNLRFDIVLNTPGTYALYAISEIWRNAENVNIENQCKDDDIGIIAGEYIYTTDINEHILTGENMMVIDQYWTEREGQRTESKPYYFRVE